uniref:FBD domain-containing protein n=1 Tax=Leersia perrieri TaxID=77586 RepID=A0A0D9WTE4_9ORYZ
MVKRQREEEEEKETAVAHQFGDGVVDPNHDPVERHDEEQQPATGDTSYVAAGEAFDYLDTELAALQRRYPNEDGDAATRRTSGVVAAGEEIDREEYLASWEQLVNEDGDAPTAKVDEDDRDLPLPEKDAVAAKVEDRDLALPVKHPPAAKVDDRDCIRTRLPTRSRRRILDFLPIKSLKEKREQQPEPRPIRCFTLITGKGETAAEDFNSCVKYTRECSPEIIHIKRNPGQAERPRRTFRLQDASRQLVRLSLIGAIFGMFRGAGIADVSFPELEEIHMHAAVIKHDDDLKSLAAAAACPLLRVLDLHKCETITGIDVRDAGPNLVRLTIMDCEFVDRLFVGNHHRLRSLHYSGRGIQRNFRSLRELQLLMSQLEPLNLRDVISFLNTCRYYPQLEKLFVQLPKHSKQSNIAEHVEGKQQEHFEKLMWRANTRGLRLILDCPNPVPEERRQLLRLPEFVKITDDSTVKSFHSQLLDEKTK